MHARHKSAVTTMLLARSRDSTGTPVDRRERPSTRPPCARALAPIETRTACRRFPLRRHGGCPSRTAELLFLLAPQHDARRRPFVGDEIRILEHLDGKPERLQNVCLASLEDV